MYKYIRCIFEKERDMSDGVDLSQRIDDSILPEIQLPAHVADLNDIKDEISLDVEYFTERQEVEFTTLENHFEKEYV